MTFFKELNGLEKGQVLAGISVRWIIAATAAAMFLVLVWGPRSAAALTPEEEQAAFTSRLAEQFSRAVTDGQVSVTAPLTLSIKLASGHQIQVNLDRVWGFCRSNPEGCQAEEDEFVDHTKDALKSVAASSSINRDSLRLAVRTTAYLAASWHASGVPQTSDPVSGPIAGELSWVLMADSPQASRIVSVKDLEDLGLTRDQAIDIGRQNVEAALRPFLLVVHPLKPGQIGIISGDYYESSRVGDHALWADIARHMSGQLVVVVPEPMTVLYVDNTSPQALDALVALARQGMQVSRRPLSLQALGWTEDGWVPVPHS